MKEYKHKEEYFQGSDNNQMYYQAWEAENETTAVIISHGYGEHSGRYTGFPEFFKGKGISFWALDHRGHGKSQGQRAYISSFCEYIADLRVFHELVKKQTKAKNIVLLGHSMGGVIAATYAIEYSSDLSGLILSAPYFKNAVEVPAFKVMLGKILSDIVPKFAMPAEVPSEHLSHDKTVIYDYDHDPLVHDSVPTRWFTEVVLKGGPEAIERANEIVPELPIFIVHGDADLMADIKGTREFYNRLEGKNVEFYEMKGFYHEVYNEVNRKKVYELTEKWMKKNKFIQAKKPSTSTAE